MKKSLEYITICNVFLTLVNSIKPTYNKAMTHNCIGNSLEERSRINIMRNILVGLIGQYLLLTSVQLTADSSLFFVLCSLFFVNTLEEESKINITAYMFN